MIHPFKRAKPWPTLGHGAVTTRKAPVMTHNAGEGTTSGMEPPNQPDTYAGVIRPPDEREAIYTLAIYGDARGTTSRVRAVMALADDEMAKTASIITTATLDTIVRLTQERDEALFQLTEAKDEIRVLQDILDSDHAIEATYLDAFKRYPGSTPWAMPERPPVTSGGYCYEIPNDEPDINGADDRRAL